MYNFKYVTKREKKPIKMKLIEIFNGVQDEVREYFTFRFDFIGSESLNMVTCDVKSNVGFDFDVNIRVNDEDQHFDACEIKKILMNGFNKVLSKGNYKYDYCEDSTRVLTIKVKDYKKSKIIHSCDIAIVYDCKDGRQQYIRFNKKENNYSWEFQPKGFYQIEERIEWLKDNGLWQEVRDYYLYKKNNNHDLNKKSRSLRAEAINDIYKKYNTIIN